MKCKAFLIFLSVALCGLGPVTAEARTPPVERPVEGIAVVVNNSAVTASDVEARMKLVMGSSGLPNSEEIRTKLQPQIIGGLVDEQLMRQEAERLGITVTPEEIEQGFARLAAQNNFSADQFRKILAKEKIPFSTLQDQISAQIAWSKVIQAEVRPQVEVPDGQIDATLARLEGNAGKNQYLVSEIFLPVTKPAEEADINQLANRLIQQLQQGNVPFSRLAGQFSQTAAAARGGDLGWVQEGQLAESLDQMLAQMNKGEVSKPVRSMTGYHILYLRDKSTVTEASLPSRDDLRQKMGMEQLDRLQRRYLLDLKAAAFIESRI